MMRYFLARIRVEGFRGINNETDPLDLCFRTDAVNSVFAVNGLGKSSIYEALSYAIRGTIPKLEELTAQERPQDYFCNRFHSKGVASIELEFLPDDGSSATISIRVERNVAGNRNITSPSGHTNPEMFLADLNEDFTLLDYRTFGKFIDSTPLERGRSFSTLLGLSNYSEFCQALKSISEPRAFKSDFDITALETELKTLHEASQTSLRRLKSSYEGLTGKPLVDVSGIDQLSLDVISVLGNIDIVNKHVKDKALHEINFDEIKQTIKSAEGGDKRKDIASIIEKITELESIGAVDVLLLNAQFSTIEQLIKEKDELLKTTRGDLFKKLYEAANALIIAGEWTEYEQCPLCENKLEISIRDLIKNQLDQYNQVSKKLEEITTTFSQSAVLGKLRTYESSKGLDIAEEEKFSHILLARMTSGDLKLSDIEKCRINFSQLEARTKEKIIALKKRKEEIEKELPPSLVTLTEQVEYGRQFCIALNDYAQQNSKHQLAKNKLSIRERWRAYIARAADTFAKAEADLSARRIAIIDTDYKGMFNRIMSINDVIPELKRASRKEDLHIQLRQFHTLTDVSARALLSESYRNALAISIYLSAALKHTGSPRFIILDDVTSSFDSGHQWNLMEYIRLNLQYPINTNGLQFIILSHDSLLEKYFDKIGNTTDWHHQKLQGCPPMGAVMCQAQDADRLKTKAIRLLSAGQMKDAEPLIRQYLEYKLLQIINKVRIPVPLDFAIKDHLKMVSNCLEVINSAIELYKKAGILILDSQQQANLDKIYVPALIGNWVSHYETGSSSSISPLMLNSVIQTIDDFAECFRFDDTSGGSTHRKWYKSLSSKS